MIHIALSKDSEGNVESSSLPENDVAITIEKEPSKLSSADNKITSEKDMMTPFLPTTQSEYLSGNKKGSEHSISTTANEYMPLPVEVITKLLKIDKEIKRKNIAFYGILGLLATSTFVFLYSAIPLHFTIFFGLFLAYACIFAIAFLAFAIWGPRWLRID